MHDASLSVAEERVEHNRPALAITDIATADQSGTAGQGLATPLRAGGEDLCAVFVLSEGLCVNGAPLMAALAEGLPESVTICGGLAGDGNRFERTLTALSQPFELRGRTAQVSASASIGIGIGIGIGLYPTDGQKPAPLLKSVDAAMYLAKARGKNSFQFSTDELAQRARQLFALEGDLRQAVARDELAALPAAVRHR